MIQAKVADLSHHNWDRGVPLDFQAARNSGTLGVIFKASQGTGYRDPTYEKSRRLAKQAGLLWGAYHFGTAGDVRTQVNTYLAAAQPDADTLICLDFEKNEQTPANTMNPQQALQFLDLVTQKLGRRPRFYTGPHMYSVFGKVPQPQFAGYRVWWARYAAVTDLHPTWQEYFLWQYTDGHAGPKPHSIPGFGFCDCNTYDGSDDELRRDWAS